MTAATTSDAGDVLGSPHIVLGGIFGMEPAERSTRRLDAFAAAGGRFVETASSYFGGRGVIAVGDWLQRSGDSLDVVHKVGHDRTGGDMALTRDAVLRDLDSSLEALHRGSVGVFVLHADDPGRPTEELADLLVEVVEQGLARSVGVSNWTAERLDLLAETLIERGHVPLASYHLSLARPAPGAFRGSSRGADADVMRVIGRHDLPMLSWSANAGGYFARSDGEGRHGEPDQFDSEGSRERRRRATALAERSGVTPADVALAWVLAHRRTWASVGAGSPERVRQALAAEQLELTPADIAALECADLPYDPTDQGALRHA